MAELAADDPHSIGGYRLLSRLGAGGMGRVYLARSAGGRTVAVKLIKAELAAQAEFRARFRLEVEAARRVGQRWTAPVLDADTEAETPWVATGYIAGPSLEQVISGRMHGSTGSAGVQGPLPEQSVRTLAYGLAGALLDIHGAGLIHRDLKPSNVLVTIDGPRVIDFGIARALDAVADSTMTGTGVLIGSPSYMSPEQIRAGQVGPASDVFCMGAVLAYAATGRTPFGGGGGGVHSVMFRIAAEEPDLEGIEEPLRGLIASCLAKDPAERPAPEDVVGGVQPISSGTASAPWLPAALIAELGRHAVQLLDTDTPPSGSGPPGAPSTSPTASLSTSLLPKAEADGAAESQPQPHAPAGSSARRPRRRLTIAGLAAVVVAGVAFAASGAELPLLDSGSGGGGGGQADSDVPKGYVGTWTGPVTRDGEPTGQHRRFVISEGQKGEVVANSTSLGLNYQCKSDGKLVAAGSAGKSLDLDTKVVKSVPEGKCSALGSHTLTRNPDATLSWAAAGRTATLTRVREPEKLPTEYLGAWQRPLPGGGTQTVTVKQVTANGSAIDMVSEAPDEHCEATAGIFSVGGDGDGGGEEEPIRLAPPAVDKNASSGVCRSGGAATLRLENDRMVRTFTGSGQEFAYTRAE